MTVSVIVPTYNGAHRIQKLMHALMAQSYAAQEVIVVLDGSTDGTLNLLQSFQGQLPLRILSTKNSGRAIARNTGAAVATGNLLVFYDDDMEPEPASIAKHVQFHMTYAGILTGNQEEFYSLHKTDIQNYKAHLTNSWSTPYHEGLNKLDYNNLFFTAANSSFKKVDFDGLQGFNKNLTDAEDYELALRALETGLPVYFDKSNHAIHHDLITCRGYIKRQQEYRHAATLVAQQHRLGRMNRHSTSVIKNFLYFILTIPLLPRMIDRFNLFIVLPKKIRYRFYSAVIYAQATR